jgi:hypothetical protein
VAKAVARNAARHDPTALGQKIPQEPDVLEINGALFDAKPAWPAPLKEPASTTPITPSTTSGTFPFHNLPHSYCGSSYS